MDLGSLAWLERAVIVRSEQSRAEPAWWGRAMTDPVAMAPMAQDEYVVVWLVAPALGTDPDDGVTFTSDRHKVPARWVRQDAHERCSSTILG